MIRIKLLFILPLVVAVTVAQTTGGYTYYGSSNVRDQRPQPIYGRRPLVLPLRPVPTTSPVTQGPVAPAVTEAPAAPAELAPIIADSEAAAPAVVPALAPRPIYTPTYRPLLPPRPLRPSPLVVAPPQPAVISEPQPTVALPPVTETVLPVQPVEVSTPEAIRVPAEEPTNSIIQPLPAATIPQPEPIHHGYGINDQIEPISQPEPIRQPEPFPQPEPVRQPEPVPQPEPVRQDEPIRQPEPFPQPEPVRQPEPVPQPEPVRQDEPVRQPEPIPQAEPVRQDVPVRQPENIPQPELVLQPKPVWQPEPIPQPKPIPQPEPIRQPELVLQPEPVQQPEPQPEPISQPEAVPVLELTRESELAEEPKPALVAIPTGTVPNRLVALPPLLPKPQPVRETAFGRHPQHTPPPMNYRPTFAPPTAPTYTYPPARPLTQPPPVRATTLYQPPLTRAPVTQSPVSRPVTQAPGHIVLDFQCKEENGYYSVIHQCDSYIECKGGRAMQYACPDGLHFNPAAKKFEYPCAYPSEVQCMAGDEEQDPKPSGTCPNQYGFYSMNDGDCSKFIMCQEGLATIMDCPMGLVFNPRTSSCDWPANVPQCNPSVFKDFTCPAAPLDENGQVSDIILNYRFYADCKLYIACQLGRPRLLSCDPGLSFDEASQTCINEDYVADCAVPYSSRH